MRRDSVPEITHHDLKWAYRAFRNNEPRDLFYRVAYALVEQARCNKCRFSVAEAVAVVLQTWNQAYYRYNRFTDEHMAQLECLLSQHKKILSVLRKRSLKNCDRNRYAATAQPIYADFENTLGPVGAAKCLHLLAPDFFPLWDRAIAREYGCSLGNRGMNAARYCRFVEKVRSQCESLQWQSHVDAGILKAIDEYNYCTYTLKLTRS